MLASFDIIRYCRSPGESSVSVYSVFSIVTTFTFRQRSQHHSTFSKLFRSQTFHPEPSR